MNNELLINDFNCDFTRYRYLVKQIPRLTEKEEFDLASKSFFEGCKQSAQKLIMSNLRFVLFVAYECRHYGHSYQDLVQEGNIGLMKAVKKFDPTKGVRLVSFAVHYIKSEIYNFIIKNWDIVNIATTKAQRKLFFNLKKYISNENFNKQKIESICEDLKVSEKDVITMHKRLYNKSISIDNEFDDDDSPSYVYTIPDNINHIDEYIEKDYIEKNLNKIYIILDTLIERDRDIFKSRRLLDVPIQLKDLSEKYNISMARVEQIEKKVLSQLKNQLGIL